MVQQNIPRVLLAAGASGSGKTTITCGLLQALVQRNKKVASFKCGPDYIDPMFHSRVIGTKSRNLDTFFSSPNVTCYLLGENAGDCDIAVMEGVMGYYDGVGGTTVRASAYDLARTTDTPVILIVNSRGMSISLMAYIKGFLEYQKDSRIKGVIFNQMSAMLYPRMKKLAEEELGIRVLGYVPKMEDCFIDSRHLGLVLPHEIPHLRESLEKLAAVLNETLDMEGILEIAENAVPLTWEEALEKENPAFGFSLEEPVHIAVARDEAFCFIYEDNLNLLRKMGARISFFSPIHDKALPEGIHGMLLYGGYPELNAKALENNISMRRAVYKAIKDGMPCMAECGGFMYLHEKMEDMDRNLCDMAGVIPGRAYKTSRLGRFGYISLSPNESAKKQGLVFSDSPAHEFHYFDSTDCGEGFTARKPESTRSWECLHTDKGFLAGFPHMYYYGNPQIPRWFLKCCDDYRNGHK
ncbi:MAG: cobyrinate a,c-diamide synthase [Blautia sp.]|nr:cobyrinate a,c-diamide synthase [Blautia sp.]